MLFFLLLPLLVYEFPLLPILFGMAFARLALIPAVQGWNQTYGKRMLTSFVLAVFATLILRFIVAYANVEWMLDFSGARRNTSFVYLMLQDVGKDGAGDVEKELWMRELRPRLDDQPCYSKEVICKIANEIEIDAREGYAPSKESMKDYLWMIGKICLWAWVGSLFVVLRFTTKKPGRVVSA